MRIFKILLAAMFLSGCISTYRGPIPNLELRGAEAEQEYQKFKFVEGFWSQGQVHFTMEQSGKGYFTSSLEPTITEVSPKAWQIVEDSKVWRYVALGSLAGMIAMLVIQSNQDRFFNSDQTYLYYGLLGVSLTGSLMRASYLSDAATQYNQDLRHKLTPALSLNFSFE